MPDHYIHIAAADRGVALLERLDVWHILGSLVPAGPHSAIDRHWRKP
jgi:hypothetical protein